MKESEEPKAKIDTEVEEFGEGVLDEITSNEKERQQVTVRVRLKVEIRLKFNLDSFRKKKIAAKF